MRYSVAYDKALEISKNMEDSVLQRLNFFLIATAFLIAGLATLVASGNDAGLTIRQLTLAYIINALGLYLSLFFTAINFHNIDILTDFGGYIRTLEQGLVKRRDKLHITEPPPATKAEDIANLKMKGFPWSLLGRLFRQLYSQIASPHEAAKGGKTNHTFLVPLLFVVVWLVIFFSVFPLCWMATAVVFGLICLSFAVIHYLPKILKAYSARKRN